MRKNLIAMILVGGKGTRLGGITRDLAKPAVSFGGKYRLIDFTLSNITNSNIDIVGIITQYEPQELMTYIGSGASWDLDYIDGGIRFLTPYATNETILWQQGTADAVKQYFKFITENRSEYVLILSGDHIYKMDYERMFAYHIERGAEVTIAGTKVAYEDASRYGVMMTDENKMLVDFKEKPDKPTTNLASMGVYLFNTSALEELLSNVTTESDIDFGKNIIPRAIKEKRRVAVYEFNDYWADVGTIKSLYQANMDLLDNPDFLTLNLSKNLPIYSKSLNLPPHIVMSKAKIANSIIADGSIINGTVKHSVLGYQSIVKEGAIIEDSVILPGVVIGKDALIKNAIVNRNQVIPDGFVFTPEQVALYDGSNPLKPEAI
ncbi:MAG: glucose-1-phosphate adenylyltransferase [Candidatus Izemoplasmatales bacterium]|nr:glucose-1-phosphate adenylyltransferase [Candidatus Izemoplasmatales bacterium]